MPAQSVHFAKNARRREAMVSREGLFVDENIPSVA
jgi:hypothetical protein